MLLVVLLWTVVRRSRRRGDERVSGVVRTLEDRLEELAAELAGALERAEEAGRGDRFTGEIASSLDLDEVLERLLDAATTLVGADAALVHLEGQGPGLEGAPLAATRGLPSDGAGPPDHGGLAVPLPGEVGPLGYLTVYMRDLEHGFADDDARRLGELAAHAAPAIQNALRFREARRLADVDALTGLHNRRYFYEMLAREVSRAHRYSRRLALIVFDVDDFKNVNDRVGHLGGDTVLAEVAERVRSVLRRADVSCRVGGDEFAVIMPESGLDQAEQLFARLQNAISGSSIGRIGRLHISAGIGELRPDDDPVSLFERADTALYRAKGSGKGQAAEAEERSA